MVSPEEADFQTGKISVTSPIGQGLMGKSVGEIVKIRVPACIIELKILSVE
jgi:transcription elongation factor GreA